VKSAPPARVVSSGTSPLTGPAEEWDGGLLGQSDFIGVATRLLQLEQAAGAVAQGLRAKR
jgi:hypothetical protein